MYSIGVDIGGTSARVALFDDELNLLDKSVTETADKEFEEIINEISNMINEIDKENKAKVVGMCSPGPLDKETGTIFDAPNLPKWSNKPFLKLFEEKTNRKVYLTNDANAAAMAQAITDDRDTIVFITVSTGLGGGIVYEGRLMEGKKVYAGEFGLMIIADDDRKHNQLYAGTWESLCSGTALSLEATKRYGKEISTKELFEKYNNNEEIAVEIIKLWTEHFSRGIANLLQTIEPEIFYLGGSVITKNQFLIPMIIEKTKDKVYEGLKDRIFIEVAKYGDDAGLVGAAKNGINNFERSQL
ncbi:ROK family protein [Helcococcus kunzii]|uniref:ROK family protein (Putative glucokinase) n=1 Tax=Helcococcus kunzii ATCC 51366 TaxID=883114 RepID=H3NNW4_9FIRM|nr:ROK family protein [Helcococcus kunzii]EHR34089.1 hypothetical protein HMPREF9709_01025 [Helcococcus kunzii ATCC 51366]QZO75644.1 ROK family protein [Helcococcus kunzii]